MRPVTEGMHSAGDSRPGAVQVLFVSSHAGLGGSELYLERLLGALGAEWRAGVIALADGPFVARLRERGVAVEVIPTGRRAGIVRSALHLRRRLRRARPVLVHANGVKAALLVALAGLGGGPPAVWVKHDFSRDGRLARWVARRCRTVVGVSSVVTESLGPALADRIRTVSPGVAEPQLEPQRARAMLDELAGWGTSELLIALVGRLGPDKGALGLIEAAPAIRRRFPGARAILIGRASCRERV